MWAVSCALKSRSPTALIIARRSADMLLSFSGHGCTQEVNMSETDLEQGSAFATYLAM